MGPSHPGGACCYRMAGNVRVFQYGMTPSYYCGNPPNAFVWGTAPLRLLAG